MDSHRSSRFALFLFFSIIAPSGFTSNNITAERQQVLHVLEQAGYMTLSTTLQIMDVQFIPKHEGGAYTLFAPNDGAFAALNLASPTLLPILQYHVVTTERLSYQDLLLLPLGSRLKTLLPNRTLLVTTPSPLSQPKNGTFSINRVPIVNPDIYSDEYIKIQGISHLFETSVPCTTIGNTPPPPPPPPPTTTTNTTNTTTPSIGLMPSTPPLNKETNDSQPLLHVPTPLPNKIPTKPTHSITPPNILVAPTIPQQIHHNDIMNFLSHSPSQRANQLSMFGFILTFLF